MVVVNKISKFIKKVQVTMKTSGFKLYFKHVGWNFFGRVINIFVAFAINIFVVRYLGPEKYGFLSYAVSFAGIFSFLAGFGIESLLYVDLVKYPKKRDKLLGTSFVLKLIGATLTIIALIIALIFSKNDAHSIVAILIIACSNFFIPFNIINLYFQAKVFSKPTAILSIIVSLSLSLLKVLFVVFGFGIFFFISIFLLESIFMMVGNIVIYRKNGQSIFNWKFDKCLAKKFLLDSWPLMFASASVLIYSRIDQIMINHIIDQTSVGIYDIAVRLAENWYMFPSIIVGSLYPAIINAGKISKKHHDNRLIKLYALLFYTSLFFILPVSILSGYIINLFYGERFIQAAQVLRIYIWSGVGVSIGIIVNQYLIAQGYTKISFLLNFVNMAINVILNIILIPRYGLTGAAFATLISYSIFPITIIFFKKTKHQAILIIKAILLKGIIYGK